MISFKNGWRDSMSHSMIRANDMYANEQVFIEEYTYCMKAYFKLKAESEVQLPYTCPISGFAVKHGARMKLDNLAEYYKNVHRWPDHSLVQK